MKKTLFFAILGVVGLITFIFLYNHTYPIAAVELKISRDKAIALSRDYLLSLGFNLENFTPTAIFYRQNDQALYLQSVLGVKGTNELIRQDNFLWVWSVRWFRELEKEEFSVGIDPATGKIAHYRHRILDETEGTNLTSEEARPIAEAFLKKIGFDLEEWKAVDTSQQKQKNRTDHSFEWEKKEFQIGDATLRVYVNILGDRAGGYWRYFKVPEKFMRDYQKKRSYGYILGLFSSLFTIFIYLVCFINLFKLLKRNKFYWQFSLYAAILVGLCYVFEFFNSIPLLWASYDTTMSKVIYFNINFLSTVIATLLFSLMVFLFGSVGHSLSLEMPIDRLPFFTAWRNNSFSSAHRKSIFIGYLMAFFFLGFVTLFYYLGIKYFGVWMPMGARYSNMLGTYFPFLNPFTVGVSAAISEEFMFRLFAISLFKKYFKKDFIAILIPAVIWAFAHSTYEIFPPYVRGIELTIVGIILGYLFLKFGLETVIIMHYAIDAILVSVPLLESRVLYYEISGVIVIFIVFIPLLFISLLKHKRLSHKLA
ncbi:MAG: CPBP family intramembrane metalloprotease [Candidatus Omnitrophica bacterium]|nr:CPBP family intramembrane metalloprotease [Candidatus Omnitrophota bacterium]